MVTSHLSADINVINIEASSFDSRSFPVEIALMLGNGQTYRSLVRPVDPDMAWDLKAAEHHGITLWELEHYGKYPDQICNELNMLCEKRTLLSDKWVVDQPLLNKLFYAASVPCEIAVSPFETLVDESLLDEWSGWKSFIAQVLDLEEEYCIGTDKARLTQTAISLLLSEYGNNLDHRVSHKAACNVAA